MQSHERQLVSKGVSRPKSGAKSEHICSTNDKEKERNDLRTRKINSSILRKDSKRPKRGTQS
jgi:hypothetical protein